MLYNVVYIYVVYKPSIWGYPYFRKPSFFTSNRRLIGMADSGFHDVPAAAAS